MSRTPDGQLTIAVQKYKNITKAREKKNTLQNLILIVTSDPNAKRTHSNNKVRKLDLPYGHGRHVGLGKKILNRKAAKLGGWPVDDPATNLDGSQYDCLCSEQQN